MLGDNAAAPKFVPKVDAVPDARGKYYGGAMLAETMPVRNDIADQFGPIDPFGEFALDVIAALETDPR